METTNKLPESTGRVDPRAVTVITIGDVQQQAQQTINRELSGIELMQVQAILEPDPQSRTGSIQDAICTVLGVYEVPDTYKSKGDLKDAILKALRRAQDIDSHEIMSAFQQALNELDELVEWDVTWSEYHKATVTARTEVQAMEAAAHYASENDTQMDSDAYEVHEHD